ncbi:cobyric acid synthase [Acrasis kona]|uniref:Cobyric acid synthase n=1 Tax=Acrasis kona TaxID=1008807 RepID=A0AAW2YS41_9EUKA
MFVYKWPAGTVPGLHLSKPYEWYVHNHGDGNGKYNANVRSRYLSLVFTISEFDSRVWVKYVQTTEYEVPGETESLWYETA